MQVLFWSDVHCILRTSMEMYSSIKVFQVWSLICWWRAADKENLMWSVLRRYICNTNLVLFIIFVIQWVIFFSFLLLLLLFLLIDGLVTPNIRVWYSEVVIWYWIFSITLFFQCYKRNIILESLLFEWNKICHQCLCFTCDFFYFFVFYVLKTETN